MTKLAAFLDQIDSGSMLLPEFQRGYVWNRDQVRGLMRSLYLGYPVGSVLTWETVDRGVPARGAAAQHVPRVLILDGQQRITSLYGITRGRPPAFFQGDEQAFCGLRFHVDDEIFEFYAPAKMRDDPRWVDVTSLYARGGLESHIAALGAHPRARERVAAYAGRLARLRAVLDRDLHEEKITGEDKTIDVVVDIFNLVNSGGTKLSKGDLALARRSTQWPEARAVMRDQLDYWEKESYSFTLDWLLRNVSVIATGRTEFSSLDSVDTPDFKRALESAVDYISRFLEILATYLGLDHNQVLMGRYAFPVICRMLQLSGGHFTDQAEIGRVLFWYVNAALRGRYAGSGETMLNQDFATASRSGVPGLIGALERWRGGNLAIDEHDFAGSGQGARCYPLLYLLTRVHAARDFGTGQSLAGHRPGRSASLQVHHVFPKAALYQAGYSRSQVNAVANYCFLPRETSLIIANREPHEFCGAVEATHPGALASQWIPQDPGLWRVDRYLDFLAARRELLARAANDFLGRIRSGDAVGQSGSLERLTAVTAGISDIDSRADQVMALVAELVALGCADPAVDCEVADPATGEVLAIAEACWPEGLRPGQERPVALVLEPAHADLPRLRELGYEVCTSAESLRGHVLRDARAAVGQAS